MTHRQSKRSFPASRRDALSRTAKFVAGGIVVLAMVFMAAWNLGR